MSSLKFRLLLLMLIMLAVPAHSATRTGVVNTTRTLAFGRFVAGTGGSVILTPLSARSKTGGVVLLAGGTISSASFSLTEIGNGKSLRWTTITLPATATLTNGAASMTLSNFSSNPSNTLLGTFTTTLTVGATLTVAANQAPGNYSGAFSVSVNYE
jgi:hypothetical protein